MLHTNQTVEGENRTETSRKDLAPETYPWAEIVEDADTPTPDEVAEEDPHEQGSRNALLSRDDAPSARVEAVVNAVASRRSLQRDDARSVVGEAHYIGLIEVTGRIAYLPATDEQNQSYRSVTTDT